MHREELDYIWSSFEMHIACGKLPAAAWDAAFEDWFYVYKIEDDRTILQRAAQLALKQLQGEDYQDDTTRVSDQTQEAVG